MFAHVRPLCWIAPLCLSAGLLTQPAHASTRDIPFEELAASYIEAHCPDGNTCSFEEVLAASYATIRLGAFEIAVPAEFLKERQRSSEVPEMAIGVLQVQQLWVETLCDNLDVVEEVRADVATLTAWFEGWKYGDYSRVAKQDDKELTAALGASPEVKAAVARLAETIMSRDKVGVAPQYTDVIRMLMCPTRRDFMEFIGFSGKVDADSKTRNWIQGVDDFTQIWMKRNLVLSMQYAPWGGTDPNYHTGMSMDKTGKNGLLQHIVQQATRALVFTSFNRNDLALLEKGLAVHFTIAICGIANTIDGDGSISDSGATTAPYSRFVPGGNPNGGILPAIPAAMFSMTVENHWREGLGKDFFLKPLRKGQKAGYKRASKDKQEPLRKDKRPHFALEGDSGSKATITAPFLGELATERQYPDANFMNDYREFYRSYQACFLHWLEQNGDPESPEASKEKFRKLLVTMGTSSQLLIDTAVSDIYGAPISGGDDSVENLEWRFLTWLEDQ